MEKGARLRRGNIERGRGHGSVGRMMSSVQPHATEDGSDARVDRRQVHTNLEERSGRQSCRLGSRRGPGLPRTPCGAPRTRVVPGAERGPQRSGTGRVEGPRHPEEFGRSTHRDGAGEIRPVVSIREEEGYIVRADLDGRAARVVHDDADPDTHVVETRQRGRRREIQEGRPPVIPDDIGNVFTAEPDGPLTSTTPSTRTTPVALGVDQFTRSTALPNAGAVAFVLTTV